jgi:hypothetical protein
MTIVNKGFRGRRAESARQLPPGQHLTADFPVLQAGPTPRIDLDDWRFTIRDERGAEHGWTWAQLQGLPRQRLTVDIHCVTAWSKLDTKWEGVSLDTLFESVDTAAEFALIGSYGGFSAARPGSSTATRANRCPPRMVARRGCWYRTCISGSPRSGCDPSSCATATHPDSGSVRVITATATRGANNATPGIDSWTMV